MVKKSIQHVLHVMVQMAREFPVFFPAIAGSPVANGPVKDHINLILYGKPGTAMTAFAKQLNDEEVAAVITYQRNSFGNNTGDVVLPQDIKAQRN